MATTTKGADAQTQTPTRRLFTSDEFERMGEVGVFEEDDRVELIEGEIYQVSAIGVPHAICVNNLTALLGEAYGRRIILSIQNPVHGDQRNFPQPDVTVLRLDAYGDDRHPRPADVLLIVEVSDSTLRFDARIKLPVYPRVDIEETWIVDLKGRVVHRYTQPSAEGYQSTVSYRSGDVVESTTLPSVRFAVDDILPRK